MTIDQLPASFGGPTAGYTGSTGVLPGFEGLAPVDENPMGGLPSGMTWEEYQNSPLSIQNADPSRLRTIEGKSVTEFGSMAEYERALTDFMTKPAVQPPDYLQQTDPDLFKTLTDEYNDKTHPLIGTNAFEDAEPIAGLRYSQYDSPEEYQTDLDIYNTSRRAAKAESGDQGIWERVRVPLIAGAAMVGGAALIGGLGGAGAAGAGGAGTGTAAGVGAGTAAGTGTAVGTGVATGTGAAVGGGGAALGGLAGGGTAAGTVGAGTIAGGTAAGGGAAVAGGGAAAAGGTTLTETLLGTAIGVGGSLYSSGQASDAAEKAAAISAQSQQGQLDYLQQINAVPQQYKEAALQQLGGAYGLNPDVTQDQFMQGLQSSPMYQAIQSGRGAGEESILRNASATGGLRSGNVQEALYDYNVRLENQGLQNYMGGLQGMAGLPTNENQIGNVMSGIGQTQAAGLTASSQAQQAGLQGAYSALGTGVGTYFDQQGKGNI